LDIKGAFDRVCCWTLCGRKGSGTIDPKLLNNPDGYPVFCGEESIPLLIHAGVPRSPLPPILFILYIASLYEALEEVAKISVIGFADDTNIIAFGQGAGELPHTRESMGRMRKMVRKQRDGVRAREKRAYPLLKDTKPASRSSTIREYYKRAHHVYSVLGSMVGQETHMESTPKRSSAETGNTTAHADQTGGCVLGFLPY
jgi:hypothetical protein